MHGDKTVDSTSTVSVTVPTKCNAWTGTHRQIYGTTGIYYIASVWVTHCEGLEIYGDKTAPTINPQKLELSPLNIQLDKTVEISAKCSTCGDVVHSSYISCHIYLFW